MHSLGDPEGYYHTLGVPRTATAEEIRRAFRERAKLYHPDHGGTRADADRFARLHEAYETLRDQERRRKYDSEAIRRVREQTEARRAAAARRSAPRRHREPPREARRRGGGAAGLLAALLALAFLGMSALWWSAQRQLDTRNLQLTELYYRLSELQTAPAPTVRATGFTTLAEATAPDAGGELYAARIEFSGAGPELDPMGEGHLEDVLLDVGRAIDRLPIGRDWLVLVESGVAEAAGSDGVAIDRWELALLRLALVVERLGERGIPPERLASRFEAGNAAVAPGEDGSPAIGIRLLCCLAPAD